MHAHNNRAGRFTARLGLESLEGRTLLSATLATPAPVPAPAVVHQSATMQVQSLQATQTTASYSYHWNIGPSAVLTGTNSSTGNGRSTGSVMVALYRTGSATGKLSGAVNALPVARVTTTSSADANRPDHFNTPYTISLTVRDATSGISGTVTFKGTITGTMSVAKSNLTMTLQGPLTRQIKLGKHIYTVTLKTGTLHIPAPGSSMPALIGATIGVRNA